MDLRYTFTVVSLSMLGCIYVVFELWQSDTERRIDEYVRVVKELKVAKERVRELRNSTPRRDLAICQLRLDDALSAQPDIYIIKAELRSCASDLDTVNMELIEAQSDCGGM